MKVALRSFSLPLVRPLHSALGEVHDRKGFWLSLAEGPDQVHGEACPMPGFSPDDVDMAGGALEHAVRMLEAGLFPDSVAAIADMSAVFPSPAAAHALEQVLLGRLARIRGVGVADLLGTKCREFVPRSILVADAADAARAVAGGATAVKLKVGKLEVEAELAMVAAVRAAIGPDCDLRLDANGAWDLEQARHRMQRLASLDIASFEDPVLAPSDFASLASVGIPLAVDMPLTCGEALDDFLDVGVSAVVVKPMVVGGLVAAMDLLRTATKHGAAGIVTTVIEGRVGRAGAEAVALAAPDPLWPCGLDTGGWLAEDPLPEPL